MKTKIIPQMANYKIIAHINAYVKQDEKRLEALRDEAAIRIPEFVKQRAIRRLVKRIKGYYIVLATLPKL